MKGALTVGRLGISHTEKLPSVQGTSSRRGGSEPSQKSESKQDAHSESSDEEYVKVDVYATDWYENESSDDFIHSMNVEGNNIPPGKDEEHILHMRKVQLRASKKAKQRPLFSPQEKECLATFMNVAGHNDKYNPVVRPIVRHKSLSIARPTYYAIGNSR